MTVIASQIGEIRNFESLYGLVLTEQYLENIAAGWSGQDGPCYNMMILKTWGCEWLLRAEKKDNGTVDLLVERSISRIPHIDIVPSHLVRLDFFCIQYGTRESVCKKALLSLFPATTGDAVVRVENFATVAHIERETQYMRDINRDIKFCCKIRLLKSPELFAPIAKKVSELIQTITVLPREICSIVSSYAVSGPCGNLI